MALNFQGDRAVGVLNDPKNTFNTDDLFRVYDGGILVAGGVSVDHGDFVSWDGTKWKLETDIKIARSDEISNTNSSIAPNYTKKTYEANSYVMQDGVLYTNPNAIGTAEDWNPAHWTQTTVAEMVSSAGPTPYTNTTESFTMTSNMTKTVGNREVAAWNITVPTPKTLTVNCSGDCAIYIYKNGQDLGIDLLDENGNNLTVVIAPAPYVYSESESVEIDGSEYSFVTDCYIDPLQGSYIFIRVIGKIALIVESETQY